MKHIKKLLSILMVLTLVLSLGATALAATVTLPDGAGYEGHTMVAYKIFNGAMNSEQEDGRTNPSVDSAGSAALGVTDWANGVDKAALLDDLANTYNSAVPAPDPQFASGMTAVDAAKAISSIATQSGFDAVAFSRLVAKHIDKNSADHEDFNGLTATLGSGYWIIIDETPKETVPQDFAYSAYLLEVVGNETLTLADKVDIPSSKKDVNGVDAVVAGLGEVVEFNITATLPDDYAKYATYYLEFVDHMDDGLTLVPDSFVITYNASGVDKVTNSISDSDVTTAVVSDTGEYNGWTSINYVINDLKTANKDLKAGDTVVLTYKATVNENAVIREYNDAHIVYTNTPDSGGHGKTPEDRVTVFNFTVKGTKVQNEKGGDPLADAGFNLLKKLDTAPSDYTEVTWEQLGILQKDAVVKYKGEYYINWNVKQKSDADGKFNFDKLGKGEYLLVETEVPAGWNRAEDVPFTVKDITDNGVITGAEAVDKDGNPLGKVEFKFDTAQTGEGEIPEEVIDTDGLQLPETGGIGTTIFYVIGAILVAGAVILLVTRKRMSGAQK